MSRRQLFDEDDLPPKRNRAGSDADIDITPMIDVTFLLLIFFMVSSTMKSTPDLDVPAAKYGVAVPTDAAIVVTIRAQPEAGSPKILLGDGGGPEGHMGDGEGGIRDYISRQSRRHVIIKADREVPFRFVQEVSKAVLSVDGTTFSIGVRDRKE